MSTDTTIVFHSLHVGDALPALVIEMTATLVVAGAIATRDFMPVHHDRDYANQQGAPDIFMNILSDTAYASRFLTDWAGPEAMIRKISVRLGVPVFPGHTLTYTGEITGLREEGGEGAERGGGEGAERGVGEGVVDIALRATNELGDHVSGTATLTLPLGTGGSA